MSKRVVGLDISSRRLIGVEVENPLSKTPKVVSAASIELPEGAARDSEVIDIPQVVDALKQLWAKGKFKSKRVVLGVGNQRVLVRDHSVQQMPRAQLVQALRYQVADLLPVPINETILDFYPIEAVPNTEPAEMRGLLVAALRESVETNVATLEDAGLKAVGVDLSSFAMLRALSGKGALAGTVTVAMVGPRTTHLVVVKDAVPQFVRLVPIGSEGIIDSAVDALKITREDAGKLMRAIGLAHGNDPRFQAATQAMLDAVGSISNAIRSTNAYYLGNYASEGIDRVLLLGADTRIPGFLEFISENVGLPAQHGEPFAAVSLRQGTAPEVLQELDLDCAVPVGLAIGSR